MKRIYSIIYLPIITISLLTCIACSDDDNNDIRTGDELAIETSAGEVILQDAKANEEAVKFTWNTGSNRGEGTSLTYNFKLDIAENNYETSIPKETMPEGVFSKSYTHEELNDLLLEYWKVKGDEPVEMEAKIIADVNNSTVYMKPEVAVVPFVVQPYLPPSKPLYLVGSATTAGMDPEKGVLIDEIVNGRLYYWKGNLLTGEFKFIHSQESLLPSFNKGEEDYDIVERVTEEEPDNMFTVEQDGLYGMAFNRKEMTFVYKYMPYEYVYMVGNATPAGWNIVTSYPMDWSAETPALFIYQGWLYPGEIKLPLENGTDNWNCDYLMPPAPNEPITGEWQELIFVPQGEVDYKWIITDDQAGNYILTVDTENMKIKFEKV